MATQGFKVTQVQLEPKETPEALVRKAIQVALAPKATQEPKEILAQQEARVTQAQLVARVTQVFRATRALEFKVTLVPLATKETLESLVILAQACRVIQALRGSRVIPGRPETRGLGPKATRAQQALRVTPASKAILG